MTTTTIKNMITKKQYSECHGIIHSVSVAAAGVGAGLAQIPLGDTAVLTTLQIGMIISLGKVFDLSISESYAKATLGSALAATTGRTISKILVGWIPGIGNVINASTAATLTETIGWLVVSDFAKMAERTR